MFVRPPLHVPEILHHSNLNLYPFFFIPPTLTPPPPQNEENIEGRGSSCGQAVVGREEVSELCLINSIPTNMSVGFECDINTRKLFRHKRSKIKDFMHPRFTCKNLRSTTHTFFVTERIITKILYRISGRPNH